MLCKELPWELQPTVYRSKMEESRQLPLPTALQANFPPCSPHCLFNAERQTEKIGTSHLNSLAWSESESNYQSTGSGVDVLSTRSPDRFTIRFSTRANENLTKRQKKIIV